jgi:hypothetical protein
MTPPQPLKRLSPVWEIGLISGITAGLGLSLIIQSCSILAFGPRDPDPIAGIVIGCAALFFAYFFLALLGGISGGEA